LALVGLFIWVTACTSYKQIQLGEIADYGKVRVTTTIGERQTIREPRVEADSIRGKDAYAIPLDQIAEFEAVSTDEVGTVFTVLGVVVLAGAVVFYFVVCTEEDCSTP